MPEFAPRDVLQRVSTGSKNNLVAWAEGVSLQTRSARSLEELQRRAVADRFALAVDFRRRGRAIQATGDGMYRDAISRYYYCLYHVFRAVAFFDGQGDDNQEHRVLPRVIPDDFPQAERWKNDLKRARELRNRADYNAYPKAGSAWRSHCEEMSELADDLVPAARTYLRTKGLTL
jgi:uncharacterized protein (UPF0332 family)